MKTLVSRIVISLSIACCFGFTSNAFAANCFCKFFVGGTQIGSTATTSGGYLQTSCAAQKGCHDYCNGYLASGKLDAAAAAHRCGTITITMQSAVGTESYCSNGLNTRNVTGTGVLACPAGYWSESTYMSQPHPVCVRQACPQGTMPGAPPWHLISGHPSNGGAYLTDDHGGTRFFIDASCH
jgi:hypothetical protein